MKKVVNLLYFIFLILFCHLTRNSNMFLLTVSFSTALIFFAFFSTVNISGILDKYKDDNNAYIRDRIFKFTIILITIIFLILTVIAYFLGIIINMDGLCLINVFMSLSVYSNVIIKLVGEYLEIIGYRKVGANLSYFFHIINILFLTIVSILLFKVFGLPNYINIIILYGISLIIFILILFVLWFLIFKL